MAVSKAPKDVEQRDSQDAWERFERAVDVVAKSPPQHRSKGKKRLARKEKPSSDKS